MKQKDLQTRQGPSESVTGLKREPRRPSFSGQSIGCMQCGRRTGKSWLCSLQSTLISKTYAPASCLVRNLTDVWWNDGIPVTGCSSNVVNYLISLAIVVEHLALCLRVFVHLHTLHSTRTPLLVAQSVLSSRNLANLFMHSSQMSLCPAVHSWHVVKPFHLHSVHFTFSELLICSYWHCLNPCD